MRANLANQYAHYLLAAIGILLPSIAAAQTATPRLFSIAPPPPGASHPWVVPMVQIDVHNRSGAEAAALLAGEVFLRGLQTSDICVWLQNFGASTSPALLNARLAYHELDALPGPADPTHLDDDFWMLRDRTLWKHHGILNARGWMDEFTREYRSLQTAMLVPPPSRFSFDTEFGLAACCNQEWMELYIAMQSDPRWASEPLPGFGVSLAALASIGCPKDSLPCPDGAYPCGPFPKMVGFARENVRWQRWYGSIASQVEDAAMHQAAYSLLHDAWPDCQTSNYVVSSRVDGQNGRDFRVGSLCHQVQYTWAGSADKQSPGIYMTGRPTAQGDNPADAVNRHNLEACIHSFGGGHQRELAPWINSPLARPDAGSGNTHAIPLSDSRRQLALLRALDVRELLLFNPNDGPAIPPDRRGHANDPANWAALAELLDQVWGSHIDAAAVHIGAAAGDPATSIMYSLKDPLVVDSAPTSLLDIAAVEVRFQTAFQTPWPWLTLNLEATAAYPGANDAPCPILSDVQVYNWTTESWDSTSETALAPRTADAPGVLRFNIPAAHHVSPPTATPGEFTPGGVVLVRVRHHSGANVPFQSRFDLIQLIGASEPLPPPQGPVPGDIDGNGVVCYSDQTALFNLWGLSVPTCHPADLNHDGVIDIHDLTTLLDLITC